MGTWEVRPIMRAMEFTTHLLTTHLPVQLRFSQYNCQLLPSASQFLEKGSAYLPPFFLPPSSLVLPSRFPFYPLGSASLQTPQLHIPLLSNDLRQAHYIALPRFPKREARFSAPLSYYILPHRFPFSSTGKRFPAFAVQRFAVPLVRTQYKSRQCQ